MVQIYLDNAATTKVHPKVLEAITEFQKNYFANPSSQHSLGREVKEKIEEARKIIANEINAEPEEIIFTSSGSEANNLAIKGVAMSTLVNPDSVEISKKWFDKRGREKGASPRNLKQAHEAPNDELKKTSLNLLPKNHIITSKIEHPCILETCKYLEKLGFRITYLNVNSEGKINTEELEREIKKETILVTIMHANNEIGTIQPIEEIGKICKNKNIPFHTDAVQTFHKEKIDVKKQNISMLSASGHKIHAPKGIGFLYIKKELQKQITPLIHGGGQENGIRSSTENTTGIIGLAEAVKQKTEKSKIKKLKNIIQKELTKIPGIKINGGENKLYNNLHISFYGIEGESLMLMLEKEGIFVSTGSACSSHKLAHSHVLDAIKINEMYLNGSIRITLDEANPKDEKEALLVAKTIKQKVQKLQEISPFKISKNKGGK